MGYTTYFDGEVQVVPPLAAPERDYLALFSRTRRMDRDQGPFHAVDRGDFGQEDRGGVRDYNRPPEGQPGLWCQWVPSEDGARIGWDEGEKFYEAAEWMGYLIEAFLIPGALASRGENHTPPHPDGDRPGSCEVHGGWRAGMDEVTDEPLCDRNPGGQACRFDGDRECPDCRRFEGFTFDHVVDGTIVAQGEDPEDRWLLRVRANEVSTETGVSMYADPEGLREVARDVGTVEAEHAEGRDPCGGAWPCPALRLARHLRRTLVDAGVPAVSEA